MKLSSCIQNMEKRMLIWFLGSGMEFPSCKELNWWNKRLVLSARANMVACSIDQQELTILMTITSLGRRSLPHWGTINKQSSCASPFKRNKAFLNLMPLNCYYTGILHFWSHLTLVKIQCHMSQILLQRLSVYYIPILPKQLFFSKI